MTSNSEGISSANVLATASPSMHGLAQFHDNSRFSDVTISCNGKSYVAHRIILSINSGVLAKACRETPTGEPIDINKYLTLEFDGSRVEAMVQFMYKFDYDSPGDAEDMQGEAAIFHVRMALLAEELNIKGITSLATIKLRQMITAEGISCQAFIKVAKMAFGDPGSVPSIRKVLTTYAADTPSLGITIFPDDPRPLLSCLIEAGGFVRRLHTILLAPGPEGTEHSKTHRDKDAFRCKACGEDQWRDDIISPTDLYKCNACDSALSGETWGTRAVRHRRLEKEEHEKEGQMFTCAGCDEEQMRSDIVSKREAYGCIYCGWEESGFTWFMLKDLYGDD